MEAQSTILIVEDNADLRRLYAIGLNRHGYKVKLAGNGAEALSRLETEAPDVILLDILMPVMNGLELLDRIGQVRPGAAIPVIVVTGQAKQDERTDDRIAAWLEKPVSLDTIVTTIEKIGRAQPRDNRSHA
jgi:CheY-like chemotaxis protein